MISISDNIWLFLSAAFINAFGYGGCQPAIQAVCLKSVPGERRGAASCTSYIGSDIGNLVGPVVAGFLISSLGATDMIAGYRYMWLIMIIPIALAAALSILCRKSFENHHD
jgi:MFS family permease